LKSNTITVAAEKQTLYSILAFGILNSEENAIDIFTIRVSDAPPKMEETTPEPSHLVTPFVFQQEEDARPFGGGGGGGGGGFFPGRRKGGGGGEIHHTTR